MNELTKEDQQPTRQSLWNGPNTGSRETSFHEIDQADWVEAPRLVSDVPAKIAEFEIRELLGRGGFGSVYEAYDTVLQRQVAIKIPHRYSQSDPADAAPDLREARAIASLDHPHIVPVYQAASAPGVPLYIVVRLIHGRTLGHWAAEVQPSFSQIAEVIAAIAEALGYAHARNVIHRDVKPSNVLVDNEGRAYIADFGLALREFDMDSGPAYVGTPAFMSPEQARGEGHRVDGRSDIFSLGVVLYELLTGLRPFRGKPTSALLNEIKSVEPEHPCHVNLRVPPELARVCLRALNKSLSGRYQRAEEMASELREYCRASVSSSQPSLLKAIGSGISAESGSLPTTELPGAQHVAAIVPKGLRAFEADDADFFLSLMPGPYDRNGLPNSIRFWKSRLESRSPADAFSVGVLYGPSGCGKTSMFRAGLLPRLDPELHVVYLQATAQETEKALLSALAGLVTPTIVAQDPPVHSESDDDLIRTFAKIRRQAGRKVILCIDQFEQWLYGHSANLEQTALAQALRHCDGIHLQCVLMVRDDFWMGISRLMQALDIPISENQNASSVDLFDKQHARRVLARFGAALGRLPANEAKWSQREQQFLTSAIDYLAVDGRVICVQLTLLAEMMKHRDWNNAALFNQDGGAGIGVAFLEQTFEADSAPRRYRNHGEGAQRLLRQLLPEPGTRIKGAIQSESQLREAVGYADENAFRELIRMLDAELHLITPTARNELESYAVQGAQSSLVLDDESGYQLTHDFLISPLRKWLDMRRMTTRLGQTQARMEEYSELYRVRPASQSLPTLVEFMRMRWWLRKQDLSQSQRRMLRAAGQHYAIKASLWALGLVAVIAIGITSQQYLERNYRAQVERKEADSLVIAALPEAIKQMETFRPDQADLWSALRETWDMPQLARDKKLRAAMALASDKSGHPDTSLHEFLLESYLQATAPDSVVLCRTPLFSQTLLQEPLAQRYRDRSDESPAVQLRLAALLAQQTRYRPVLLEDANRLVQLLVAENPLHLNDWIDVFRPLSAQLLPTIESALLAQAEDGGLATVNLASLMARYAADSPELLASLTSKVGPTAHALLLPAIKKNRDAETALSVQLTKLNNVRKDLWHPDVAGMDWWNNPETPPTSLDPSSVQTIAKKLSGYEVFADRNYLICLHVTADQLRSLENELKPSGFRVAAISPYLKNSQEQAMVLWKRDGRASEWVWPASAVELKEFNAQHLSRGHYTADLAEYTADNYRSMRFACVWTSTPPLPIVQETGIYVDLPYDEHESAGWGPLLENGFVPRINIQSLDQSGREYFTSLRWKLNGRFAFSDQWNDQQRPLPVALEGLRFDECLVDAHHANRAANSECGLTHVWWSEIPMDSAWASYAEQDKYLERCAELQKLGYRPVTIHARCDEGPTQFCSVWWRPRAHVANHAEYARKHARLAIALHQSGNSQALLEALGSTDADIRGAIVDASAKYQADPKWLLGQLLDNQQELPVRRAACHALTLISKEASEEALHRLTNEWPTLVQTEDPGLRSALKALHRSWNLDRPRPSFQPLPGKEIQTQDGKRMVVLEPPPILTVGSPAGEPGRNGHDERRTQVRMPRAFAIAVEEVTAAEYRRFAPDHSYAEDYCPTPDSPMIDIKWFDAVRYCRWLSEQENIDESEQCYPPLGSIGEGMRLPSNYLDRTGYRLPTEAEWEYAARGGFQQGRHFGFLTELLDRYAWTADNANFRGHPVAQLLPNDYGLFDMFGNAMEMCQNPMSAREAGVGPQPDPAESHLVISASDKMVSRGGATLFQPLDARAAHRDNHGTTLQRPYLSFRIVRTVRR